MQSQSENSSISPKQEESSKRKDEMSKELNAEENYACGSTPVSGSAPSPGPDAASRSDPVDPDSVSAVRCLELNTRDEPETDYYRDARRTWRNGRGNTATSFEDNGREHSGQMACAGPDLTNPFGYQIINGHQKVTGSQLVTGWQSIDGCQSIDNWQKIGHFQRIGGTQTIGSWQEIGRGARFADEDFCSGNVTQTIGANQIIGGRQYVNGGQRIFGSQQVSGDQWIQGDQWVGADWLHFGQQPEGPEAAEEEELSSDGQPSIRRPRLEPPE